MLPTLLLDLVSSQFKFSFSFFHPTPLVQLRRDAVPSRWPHSDDFKFNTTRTPPLRLYFDLNTIDTFSEPRIDIFCLPNDLAWCQSFRPFMSARSSSYHLPRVVVLWFLSRSFLAQVDAPMPPRMVPKWFDLVSVVPRVYGSIPEYPQNFLAFLRFSRNN
jgi:hypothetical protein